MQKRLQYMQVGVMSALEEVTTITTYDDNLEHQYREGKPHPHTCHTHSGAKAGHAHSGAELRHATPPVYGVNWI